MYCYRQRECQSSGVQCNDINCPYVGKSFSPSELTKKIIPRVPNLNDSCHHCNPPYNYYKGHN